MARGTDDRSRQAIAYSWASRVISISLEMVVPGFIGVWLDKKLGTVAAFTVLGFSLGLFLGILHLLQISKSQQATSGRKGRERMEHGAEDGAGKTMAHHERNDDNDTPSQDGKRERAEDEPPRR